MSIDEIKELLDLFNASGVGELEIEREGVRIRIRKAGQPSDYPAAAAPSVEVTGSPAAAEAGRVPVTSPILGTYYDAPKPGEPPFVNVGDAVEPGQVLCIIEAMKLMNEIKAEVAGVVTAKLVENGKPVDYGQELLTISRHVS